MAPDQRGVQRIDADYRCEQGEGQGEREGRLLTASSLM